MAKIVRFRPKLAASRAKTVPHEQVVPACQRLSPTAETAITEAAPCVTIATSRDTGGLVIDIFATREEND